jgi:hypothetical protein
VRSTILDTSQLRPVQLRRWMRDLVGAHASQLSLVFESFAFKRGVPLDADMVYDVRVLPNPYYLRELRPLTGRDVEVATYLREQPEVMEMLDQIEAFLRRWLPNFEDDQRSYLTVAIGCTGGQHRSVFMARRWRNASRRRLDAAAPSRARRARRRMTLAAARVEIVDWRALSPADREAVLALQISAAQIEFAGTIARSVAACEAAIRRRGRRAGHSRRRRCRRLGRPQARRLRARLGRADAAVVSGLRIDARHQGRGIGAAALAAMARLGRAALAGDVAADACASTTATPPASAPTRRRAGSRPASGVSAASAWNARCRCASERATRARA